MYVEGVVETVKCYANRGWEFLLQGCLLISLLLIRDFVHCLDRSLGRNRAHGLSQNNHIQISLSPTVCKASAPCSARPPCRHKHWAKGMPALHLAPGVCASLFPTQVTTGLWGHLPCHPRLQLSREKIFHYSPLKWTFKARSVAPAYLILL